MENVTLTSPHQPQSSESDRVRLRDKIFSEVIEGMEGFLWKQAISCENKIWEAEDVYCELKSNLLQKFDVYSVEHLNYHTIKEHRAISIQIVRNHAKSLREFYGRNDESSIYNTNSITSGVENLNVESSVSSATMRPWSKASRTPQEIIEERDLKARCIEEAQKIEKTNPKYKDLARFVKELIDPSAKCLGWLYNESLKPHARHFHSKYYIPKRPLCKFLGIRDSAVPNFERALKLIVSRVILENEPIKALQYGV